MKRYSVILICLVLLYGVQTSPTYAGGEPDCKDILPSQLVIGGQGIVQPGQSLSAYKEPDSTLPELATLPAGALFKVLEGPKCDDDKTVWWRVDYRDGQGWIAEGGHVQNNESIKIYYAIPWVNGKPAAPFGEKRDKVLEETQLVPDENGNVSYMGVSLTLPESYGDVKASLHDSVNPYNTDYGFWEWVPAYVSIQISPLGLIQVFPATLYETYYPGTIKQLKSSLARRQLPATIHNNLDLVNAGISVKGRPAYIKVPWGTLYRDLRQYNQGLFPVEIETNYRAFGLTKDGKYLIKVFGSFPIMFPAEILNVGQEGYPQGGTKSEIAEFTRRVKSAYKQAGAFLTQAPADAFPPELEALDKMLTSLKIAPDTLVDYQAEPEELHLVQAAAAAK